jgi:hypothetical protein
MGAAGSFNEEHADAQQLTAASIAATAKRIRWAACQCTKAPAPIRSKAGETITCVWIVANCVGARHRVSSLRIGVGRKRSLSTERLHFVSVSSESAARNTSVRATISIARKSES